MIETDVPLQTVTLDAGDFFFGGGQTRVSTLLGSCVSITLWHPRKRIGGMCHYMLTERNTSRGQPVEKELDGRYANEAFTRFLRHVEAAGTRPGEYQAKLFGGGSMFASENNDTMDIGLCNIDYGRQLLAAQGIALIAEHVGGSGRRKLHFDLWNGHVWLAFPEGSGAQIRKTHG